MKLGSEFSHPDPMVVEGAVKHCTGCCVLTGGEENNVIYTSYVVIACNHNIYLKVHRVLSLYVYSYSNNIAIAS